MEESGFNEIEIGSPVDTFGGAGGESKGRRKHEFDEQYQPRAHIEPPRAPFFAAPGPTETGGR